MKAEAEAETEAPQDLSISMGWRHWYYLQDVKNFCTPRSPYIYLPLKVYFVIASLWTHRAQFCLFYQTFNDYGSSKSHDFSFSLFASLYLYTMMTISDPFVPRPSRSHGNDSIHVLIPSLLVLIHVLFLLEERLKLTDHDV